MIGELLLEYSVYYDPSRFTYNLATISLVHKCRCQI